MAKIVNISEIHPTLGFTEFDILEKYRIAGMTVYDAQATRAMLEQYSAQGPEMVKKVSILCALNLYLDFVNMFMYILQLLGNRD